MAVQMSRREPSVETVAHSSLCVRLQKRFASGFALDAQFTASPGVTILFGASGAGKTTVLECIAGLLSPDAGRVIIGDRVLVDSLAGIDLPPGKRCIGYVFQEPALFPHLTVEENVRYGLARLESSAAGERTGRILRSFRIEGLRLRKPAEISGGERQRTALARALVTEPRVLLLDEPLVALDAATKSHLMDDLRGWNESRRIPIVYVTHSRDEVFALGDRVVALEHGKVLAEGTPHEVLHAPQHEALAQLAGFENIVDAIVAALHEKQGTMTCRLEPAAAQLEVPLGHARVGEPVKIAIRAGDILLATAPPQGLSARNVVTGIITRVEQRDFTVIVEVNCGVPFKAHLTPGARDALDLASGRQIWLVIKTYSCHLLR